MTEKTVDLIKVSKLGTTHVAKLTLYSLTRNVRLEIFGPDRDQDYVCVWSKEAVDDLKTLLESIV